MGADNVITIDTHSSQIKRFFSIPMFILQSNYIAIKYLFEEPLTDEIMKDRLIIVSPDVSDTERAR